jgi:hypothetical protein
MKINTSVEWAAAETELRHIVFAKIHTPKHYFEISAMIANLRVTVRKLSQAEVLARRGKMNQSTELLHQLNTDIQMVEEFILVAALIG